MAANDDAAGWPAQGPLLRWGIRARPTVEQLDSAIAHARRPLIIGELKLMRTCLVCAR